MAARDGMEEEFREFVAARYSYLLRTAYLIAGDWGTAEDLLQTALFKAAKSWERIQGAPEPYVRRILYTENISWWRRRRESPVEQVRLMELVALAYRSAEERREVDACAVEARGR